MPIATATAQGGTYTNSLTFYILKNNKKKADEAIFSKKKSTFLSQCLIYNLSLPCPLPTRHMKRNGSVKQYPAKARIAIIL
jgi:hypothetical protein